MPRDRPHLSITLPRNFTFHYTEGEEPKTPEREDATPVAPPPAQGAYRVKRRSRPTIQTTTQNQLRLTQTLQDAPVPTIETPSALEPEPLRPSFQHRMTEPAVGYLSPTNRPFMTMPRPHTPTMQRVQVSDSWKTPSPRDLGDSIARPFSRCSITSNSSDESSGSQTSYPSLGGSCTSPESDAPDPFYLPSFKKSKSRPPLSAIATPQPFRSPLGAKKQPVVFWTPEMDKHLWSAYMQYLQDPTVTPFKTLPGTAPPLGVCHRVARQAKRTWKGTGNVGRIPSATANGKSTVTSAINSSDSPEAGRSIRSGSSTPTGGSMTTVPVWPKSSSSTRRRLRYLAKRKPRIAPHYQRLLRSPSPLSSSSQSQPRSARAFSPLSQEIQQPSFNTRDIQISLTTSTAATMQPDGPLAQLAHETAGNYPTKWFNEPLAQEMPGSHSTEWFNEPPAPWASPAAIPSSDLGHEVNLSVPATEAPQLGSPFSGSHTWGPSRSRQHVRPSTPRTQSSHMASTIGPALKSPLRFNNKAPYPSVSKRRAQHQLEDELSPGGSERRKNLIEELFGGPAEGRHRRVRSRGFSLGDVNANARLEALFQQQSSDEQPNREQQNTGLPSGASGSSSLHPPPQAESVRRLGSPFSASGTGSMPTRRPSRHLASASLSAYDPSAFTSIDQRIRQTDLSDDFLKRLRE
ncbi:MAG: hypothetical protein LQ350_002399 [Teloschistes chrysophthalmus]|nr:MAG: hypothetical protein LQ350_002399 [Niorma chrysophthalma]